MAVDTPQYPVNLVLDDQPCLVVGAGRIAARKAEGLLACGARVHVIAAQVDSQVRSLEGVSWEERPYRRGDVAGYRLVVAATDDPAVNRAVYEDGEAEGVWVNSADDPASCAFTLPSVIRQDPSTACWASCCRPSGNASGRRAARPRDSTGKRRSTPTCSTSSGAVRSTERGSGCRRVCRRRRA